MAVFLFGMGGVLIKIAAAHLFWMNSEKQAWCVHVKVRHKGSLDNMGDPGRYLGNGRGY